MTPRGICRDGMCISRTKTESSVYRAWVSATEWLAPKITQSNGTWVQESVDFKYPGQKKERQGAHKEVAARLGGALATWKQLKGKLF
jgi:hypothetical protein